MNKKIAFIGGDKRMFYCAEALCEKGIECALYGFDRISDRAGSTRCPTIADCVLNSSAAVLPLPVSRDGVHVTCDGVKIKLTDVFERISPEAPIFAGAVNEKVRALAKQYFHEITDFLDDEALTEKNAFATAEGAVYLAMRSTERALYGTKCLVSGYGRIGSYTARLLSAFGAEVYVFARRAATRTRAELDGFRPVTGAELCKTAAECEIVLNTVPAKVFGREEVSGMRGSQTYIELASAPYGIDRNAAESRNLEITDGSALPSKYCPKTAGGFIAEYLAAELERMGII